jgi:ribosomal subunit interface protein
VSIRSGPEQKGEIMRYQISGQQINIGEALQEHVKRDLDDVSGKYAQRPTDANIIFSRSAHEYVCEITIHLSTGLNASAKARETEIYAAFDSCSAKLEKQLRRYKRRLKDHHRQRVQPIELSDASSYVLSSLVQQEDTDFDTLQPIIVAETESKIPFLSVGEAVMQMELAGSHFLVFRNEGKKNVNVVYLRDDGNIGWIEPQ